MWARSLRYEAHCQFLTTFDAFYKQVNVYSSAERSTMDATDVEGLSAVWDRAQALRIVCTNQSAQMAQSATTALRDFATNDVGWEEVNYRLDQYVGAVREEFHLLPIPLLGDD